MMHHNPSVKKSPVDGSWNLYTITDGGGPIEVTSSIDEGKTWTKKDEYGIISEYENPGPFIKPDNSMWMFYRDVIPAELQLDPTCSDESIGVQQCTSPTSKCDQDNNPVFKHTGEDPFVFQDGRGNYHMLINSLPGACIPKIQQGGHAWSTDGVVWSEPRVGAYNTTIEFDGEMQMADGSAIILPAVSPSSRPSASEDDELPSSWVKGGSGELSKVLGKDTVRGPITGRADLGVGVVEVTPIQTRADLSNTVTVAVTASVEVVFEVRSKVGRPTEIVLTRIGEAFDCSRADILAGRQLPVTTSVFVPAERQLIVSLCAQHYTKSANRAQWKTERRDLKNHYIDIK
ncbi:hypothetical protein ScalyP_jg7428 [Parmales sp. scaly parma]|nr:hypothetical protein ScalyP_jg7428 [Parmales sp. scaly parma]